MNYVYEGSRVGHCIGGEELTLGHRRKGEKASPSLIEKFEAHIR